MNEKINKYLCSLGLKFPENENEFVAFNETHNDYLYSLNEDVVDPHKILNDLKKEYVANKKPSNVDYHKRTVLAAEIVYQLKEEFSLGHLKLQKLIFLCQNTTNMALHTNFLRQAMGPYDPKLMRSIDTQFKNNGWFEFKKDDFPKYRALGKCGEHKEWYDRYFVNHADNISLIIETFRNIKTDQVELIATIYACWLTAIENKISVDNNQIIKDVYEWHESKQKFSEEKIEKTIEWMKENRLYPTIDNI